MNNCGSPTLTIDSPLVATRRRTNTDTTLDDEYVGTWVAFLCTGLTFYGTVKRCFLGNRQAKTWDIVYDSNNSEEVLLVEFRKQ